MKSNHAVFVDERKEKKSNTVRSVVQMYISYFYSALKDVMKSKIIKFRCDRKTSKLVQVFESKRTVSYSMGVNNACLLLN